MKKVLSILSMATVVILYSTCSNDFELNAPAKDIPVVYGFLSGQDTAHYVRIERAFLPDDQSAFEVAKDPDALYYNSLDVTLEGLDETGNVIQMFTLDKVNGADEGLARESGIFVDNPNYLYKFKTTSPDTLVGGRTYRLVINRGDNLEVVTASEVMTSPVQRFTTPRDPTDIEIIYGTQPINPIVTWRTKTDVSIYDLKIRYHIREWNVADPNNVTEKTIEGLLESNIEVNTPANPSNQSVSVSADFEPATFYTNLANQLEANPELRRSLVDFDFVAVGVGKEFARFIEVSQANTGLTSAQLINRYSNVDGGLGLFTSRTIKSYDGFSLKFESRDSLRNGVLTRDLNFQ